MEHDALVRRIVSRLGEIGRAYRPPDEFATLDAAIASWVTDAGRRRAAIAWLEHCELRPATHGGLPDNQWARREFELRRPIEAFLGIRPPQGQIVGFVRRRPQPARWLRRPTGRH
jgi:hypothetical protein